MEPNLFEPESEEPASDPLRQALEDAAQSSLEFQEKLNLSKKLEKLLGDLVRFRDRSWLLHIKSACERELEFLKGLRFQSHPSIQVIEDLYRGAQSGAPGVVQALPGDLEHLSKEASLVLDFSRSRHPRYYFGEDGFIEVQVNDRRQTADVGTREGRLASMPADAGAIIQTVKNEEERLFGRNFSGSRFLQDLRTVYLTVVKEKKGLDGDPVPIREIYQLLVKKINSCKNYRKDEFLVDLSTLVTKGPAETKGVRFELQQTKDTTEGLLLLGAAGRGMVNLLLFKKPEVNMP